uniref:Uncharacterized protein n=1 Tax=Sander lucioperca TaxID=283035 RepID=A0A8C9YWL2_SANLU
MAEARPKKRRSEEYMARRREIEKERTKTRIYIGESIQRWRELRWQKGFQSDAQVAKFLLDRHGCCLTALEQVSNGFCNVLGIIAISFGWRGVGMLLYHRRLAACGCATLLSLGMTETAH